MRTLQTPSPGHIQFDQLCQEIDEFEPLPDHARNLVADEALLAEPQDHELSPLDELILVGLVSPV